MAGLVVEAEDAHRQPADRARHPVAIEIEGRPVGGADVGGRVHRHAVDDGVEILAPQGEVADGGAQRRGPRRRGAVEAVDVVAPALQRGKALVARSVAVGDVVDGAAEGVDRVHRLAPRARQDAHGEVERAAGCRQRRRGIVVPHDAGRIHAALPAATCSRVRIVRWTRQAATPARAASAKPGRAEMHAFAQGIAAPQAVCQGGGEPVDGGDLEPETRVGDATGERRAFGEQALRALRQLGEAGAQGGGGALRTERCDRDAVRRQPVERQIDAIEGPEIRPQSWR